MNSLSEKEQIRSKSPYGHWNSLPYFGRHHDASCCALRCEADVPLIQADETTTSFCASLVKYLNVELARAPRFMGLDKVFGERPNYR